MGNLFRKALWAPIRVLLPRNPWLRFVVLALPVLLVLAFLEPAFNLVLKLVDLAMRIVQPLLDTTVGRIVLMLLVTGFGGLLVATLLRGRVREFRARLCLARHLQAVAALLGDQPKRCREQFRRVARYRGPLPAEYRALVQDARLKLARLCLDAGDADEALAWLTRVVEPKLPRELLRSLTQLRVRALRAHGAALPETLVADLEAALQAFPDDYPLHRELRELRHAAGDHAATAALQERVAKMAPAALAARERQQLVADLTWAGEQALAAGDVDTARKCAKKLRATDRDGPAAGLLLGRIQAQAGDLRAAIREWGATR
ncbi:MAG TPA: hypothetical protein VK348_00460, partial [Planctomycetota bacterium]|nr:hypothetical protein [Planctomycetota bacterium]